MRHTTVTTVVLFTLVAGPRIAAANDRPRDRTTETITRKDLGTGQEPNSDSAKYIRGRGKTKGIGCSDDDAGHIVAKNLGGSGKRDNMFPQSPSVNRGDFAKWEKKVAEALAQKDVRDEDRDEDKGEFVYKDVTIEVKFTWGDEELENRPTRGDYCYTPTWADNIENKKGQKARRECKSFANPKSSTCTTEEARKEEWDPLVKEATELMTKQEASLGNPDRFLTREEMDEVLTMDVEKLDDEEYKKLLAIVKKRQDKIKRKWETVKSRYKKLIVAVKVYDKIESHTAQAAELRKKLEESLKRVQKVVDDKLDELGSKKVAEAVAHNIKKHNDEQKKTCDESYDGDPKKPDCIDYDSCTVWEFYPDKSDDASAKRSTAMSRANRLRKSDIKNTSKQAAWNKCFDEGDGFTGKAAPYSTYK